MRHVYRMPKDERPIMVVGNKQTVQRCPSCEQPVSVRSAMPCTPQCCDVCHPDRVTAADEAIEAECAGAMDWARVLPDGRQAHVITYPEYLPRRA